MASVGSVQIRTLKVSGKGQISIPTDIRKQMKIKKGDNLVMMMKGRKIVLEKSDDIALLLDNEFKDIREISKRSLEKIWNNPSDDIWNKELKS